VAFSQRARDAHIREMVRDDSRHHCPDGSAEVGTPGGLPGTGRGADFGGLLDSAFVWIEFGGLIKIDPEKLSPDVEACRSHMSISPNKKPRPEGPGQAADQ
jgi:hypothetical protein